MATYIKTLKEDNGDITYPQTKASAVLLTNNSDLESELAKYVTAEDIASTSALTPPVTTNMIADGAVTSAKLGGGSVTAAKIDWSTINVITAACGATESDTSIAANAVIPIDTILDRVGTGFTVSGGKIVVGSGISKVLISVNVFYCPSSSNYGWFQIQKNNANLFGARAIANTASSSFGSAVIADFMAAVSSGDTLSIVNLTAGVYRKADTFVTVKQIA